MATNEIRLDVLNFNLTKLIQMEEDALPQSTNSKTNSDVEIF
jgi:hypothetical protein